jgi:photosynthetic reaction center H subunit
MPAGAITGHIDVAQLAVAAFVAFFLSLVFYLRREDKREGYPLEDPAGGRRLIGFPEPPAPKTFTLMTGGTSTVPHHDSPPALMARPLHGFAGTPLVPTGDPLRDAVGPASFALRKEEPLIYAHDKVQVLPLRALEKWSVVEGDADPRGMAVVGADGVHVGTVHDIWIDRSVKILRYIEIELTITPAPRRVLLPLYHADVSKRRQRIKVTACRAAQFAGVPLLREPDRITAREEDMVNAYYAGALFWRGPVPAESLA